MRQLLGATYRSMIIRYDRETLKTIIHGTQIRFLVNCDTILALSITGECKEARKRGQGLKYSFILFSTVSIQFKEINHPCRSRWAEICTPFGPGLRSETEKPPGWRSGATRNFLLAGGEPQVLKPGLQGAGSFYLEQESRRVTIRAQRATGGPVTLTI